VVDFFEDPAAFFVERLAGLRQAHLPGRPVQKPDAEPVLQIDNVAADSGA
jgi:hypothetical protein